jgi:hypothetical protein
MANFKRIFLILFLASFLLFIFSSFIFAQKTELEYPQVSGAETPTTVKTAFPEYIKYLFNFAIIIAGLIAFASLVYGGFRYLTSAGSPVAMSDARAQITAGLLGLIILLASFIILTTINPQLVNLKITPEQFQQGVILYATGSCPGRANPQGEESKDFLRVRRSLSSLEDFNDKTQSIYFYNSGDEMEVYIFSQENFKPEDSPSFISKTHKAGDCASVSGGQSIILYWKTPGVYLFEKTNFETPPSPRLYTADSGDFGDFHDKAKSLKILSFTKAFCIAGTDGPPGCKSSDPKEVEKMCDDSHCLCPPNCGGMGDPTVSKFGAILHENSNFEGDCQVFLKDEPDLITNAPCTNSGVGPYCQENIRDRASAITLFKQLLRGVPSGDGVTLYNNYDFNEETDAKDLPLENCHFPLSNNQPLWVDFSMCSVLDKQKASSIKVDGTYIALLFRQDGRCEVFKTPGDLRLKDNNIGDDQAKYMLVIPVAKD